MNNVQWAIINGKRYQKNEWIMFYGESREGEIKQVHAEGDSRSARQCDHGKAQSQGREIEASSAKVFASLPLDHLFVSRRSVSCEYITVTPSLAVCNLFIVSDSF